MPCGHEKENKPGVCWIAIAIVLSGVDKFCGVGRDCWIGDRVQGDVSSKDTQENDLGGWVFHSRLMTTNSRLLCVSYSDTPCDCLFVCSRSWMTVSLWPSLWFTGINLETAKPVLNAANRVFINFTLEDSPTAQLNFKDGINDERDKRGDVSGTCKASCDDARVRRYASARTSMLTSTIKSLRQTIG